MWIHSLKIHEMYANIAYQLTNGDVRGLCITAQQSNEQCFNVPDLVETALEEVNIVELVQLH